MVTHLSASNATRRSRRLFAFMVPAAVAAGLSSVALATDATWTGTSNANWSATAPWAGGTAPSNDGTANVSFNDLAAALTSTVDTSWSVNGMTFTNNGLGTQSYTFAGGTGASLTIGAGGITQNENTVVRVNVPIIAGASQTWNLNNAPASLQSMAFTSDVTINNGVNLTWAGGKYIRFDTGTTTAVGTGALTLDGITVMFQSTSQYGRLGSNAMTVTNNAAKNALNFAGGNTFATPINFTNSLTGSGFNLNYSASADVPQYMTGAWSGAIAGGQTSGTGFVNISASLITWDDRTRMVFQGNSSGLTSTAAPSAGSGAVHIQSGIVVADHANALGTGNSLGILLGTNNANVSNQVAGLTATSGNHVASDIYVRNVINSTYQRNPLSVLGLSGTGSVNFTGNLYLDNGTVAGFASGNSYRLPTLKLTAPAGGTAAFSGTISDKNAFATNPAVTPVVILGGGTVSVSGNNTYHGTTSVRGGTLLVGSATALGASTTAVSLGDTVSAPAGGDVQAATTADLANVASYASGVLTFTATKGPATLDGVTLNNGDRILYKDATGTPERTGVYVRTSADVWTRAADLDTAGEFVQGLRVHVAGGTANAAKNFYMTNGLIPTAVLGSSATDNTGAKFGFNPDAASDADVALLTNAGITVARNINVTNNLSTGDSILGGNSAHASVFSGTIALSKNLVVTAATGGSVDFSGAMTGGFNVTKEGAGLIKFSTAKAYTGSTSVLAGTLEVDDTLASSAVSVASGATLKGIGTIAGTVSAVGGALAPGNSAGTMTFGGLLLDGSSILNYELDATNHTVGSGINDLIQINGDVTLDGTLNLAILNGTDLTPGTYRLLNYTGNLTNGGLALGTGFSTPGTTYTIDTSTAGQVDLVVTVPEPVISSLLGMAGLIALGKRTRH